MKEAKNNSKSQIQSIKDTRLSMPRCLRVAKCYFRDCKVLEMPQKSGKGKR